MSKSYDDFDGMEIDALKATLRAIRARIKGEFDHPDLVAMGPLGNSQDDILQLVARHDIDS